MQVTCGECQRSLNIPDAKVPKDRAFNVTCPGCKNKIKVEDHLQPAVIEDPPMTTDEGVDSSLLGDSAVDTSLMYSDDEFDDDDEENIIYDENDQVAIILDPKNYDTWSSVLTGMEYKLQPVKSPEHTIHKLKFNEYDVLIFNQDFGDYELDENPLYQHILNMPMSSRRKIFIALLGEKLTTGDHMSAFALSVNLVINPKDIEQSEMLLKKFIKENDNFYKIYKDTMQSVGKF